MFALPALPPLVLEVPSDAKFGDLASNVAMVLARQVSRPPRALADVILRHLRDPEGWLAGTDVAGPGFINFRFAPAFWQMMLREALTAGAAYGRSTTGAGRRVQVEFVSANPTGPLHIGHGRGAVIGDVTARLLEATGYAVEREYYVNDSGRQMEVLGRSTLVRYRQLCGEDAVLPEDGYPGEYLVDVARALRAEVGDSLRTLAPEEAAVRCGDYAGRVLLEEIRADLVRFAVRFDRFVSERCMRRGRSCARSRPSRRTCSTKTMGRSSSVPPAPGTRRTGRSGAGRASRRTSAATSRTIIRPSRGASSSS